MRRCGGLRGLRWRLTVALTLALLVPLGSAARASVATTTVDRTFVCSVKFGGQSGRYLDVAAGTKVRGEPAWSLIYTALKKRGTKFVTQLYFDSATQGLRVDASLCKHSSRRVALRSSKLKSGQTVTSNFVGYFSDRCPVARRALVRVRLRESGGIPVSAQVAVISDNPKKAPIADEIWSATRVRYFVANNCVDRGPHTGP
jgi:hypothetical protein